MLTNDDANFSIEDGEITVSISDSRVRTPFIGVIGIGEMKVRKVSKAVIAAGSNSGSRIEIAMMLDVTGSMCGGYLYNCTSATKLDAMMAAAKDLIDIVVWQDQSVHSSRVALIPFSEHLNVGATYFNAIAGTIPGGSGDARACFRKRDGANRYEAARRLLGTRQHGRPSRNAVRLVHARSRLRQRLGQPVQGPLVFADLGTQRMRQAPTLQDGRPHERGGVQQAVQRRSIDHPGPRFCAHEGRGVVIYTIDFEIGTSGSAYETMQQCASSEEHFYNASNGEELRMSFRDIAMQVSTLWLAE